MSRRTTARVLGVGASLVGLLAVSGCALGNPAAGAAEPTFPAAVMTPQATIGTDREAADLANFVIEQATEKTHELINDPSRDVNELAAYASESFLENSISSIERDRAAGVRITGSMTSEPMAIVSITNKQNDVSVISYSCLDRTPVRKEYASGKVEGGGWAKDELVILTTVGGTNTADLKVTAMSIMGPQYSCP